MEALTIKTFKTSKISAVEVSERCSKDFNYKSIRFAYDGGEVPPISVTPDSPLGFFKPAVPIFVFSTHHDFMPISCSARTAISCQFYVQHASRFRMFLGTIVLIFVLGPEITFSSLPRLVQIPTSLKQW